ncbi:hypothetical protein Tco_0375103 [Tanacetum coccineum]
MEIKQENLENYFIGTKRKPLFNNVNVTTLLKKVKEESVVPQNESEEIEMKTDTEIKDTISRMKNNLKNFASKLRDGGEKLKASLRKYEDELERRNKIKPPPVLPVNIPVSAEVEPKSLLISSPAPPPPPPPEPQQAPNTHSVDSVQHMISNGDKKNDASNISFPNRGLAVNKPLFSSGSQHGVATSVLNEVVTLATESTGRKPSASGNDDRPPVTFLKSSSGVFVQQNQEQDIELKTDSEIKETIARLKRNLVAFGHKLHDKGEKIKEYILRYEHELQRRNKHRESNVHFCHQEPAPQAQQPPPQECPQSTVTHLVDSVKQMVSNDGNKDGDSNLPSRDPRSRQSMSEYGVGVAANGSTVNADKHDSLTDEKMLTIVHELVTVGIAHTEVGKAAEVCYKDPVKAKVLFALPEEDDSQRVNRSDLIRGFNPSVRELIKEFNRLVRELISEYSQGASPFTEQARSLSKRICEQIHQQASKYLAFGRHLEEIHMLEMASPNTHDAVTLHLMTVSQDFMTASDRMTQPKI